MLTGMAGCVTELPLLDELHTPRLDRFLELGGYGGRDRKALVELYQKLSVGTAESLWPQSVAQMFGTTSSTGYRRFTSNAALPNSRASTRRWADAVMREPALVSRQAALLDLVSTNWAGGGGWVLKAGLVLGKVQPVHVQRTYLDDERISLVVDFLKRLSGAGHHVPVLTTRPDHALVALMLDMSVRWPISWTGRVSSQFAFPPHLSVKALHSAPLQTLNVAEIVAASDDSADAGGSFAWVQINRDRYYLLYGPSAQRRYYLRCRADTKSGLDEQRVLLRLVETIESFSLGLTSFNIERLRVLRKNCDSYESLTQAILWLWRFALQAQRLDLPATKAKGSIQDDGEGTTDGRMVEED